MKYLLIMLALTACGPKVVRDPNSYCDSLCQKKFQTGVYVGISGTFYDTCYCK